MAILKDLTSQSAVKSMSLLETAGAGIIGGVVNGIAVGMLPNINPWLIAGGEIVAGAVAGGIIGGKVGDMAQSGLIITGMAKVSDALVNTGRAMLGGGNSQASAGNAQQTNLY